MKKYLLILLFIQSLSSQWKQVKQPFENARVSCIASFGDTLFAGSYNYYGVFLSTNNGSDWVPAGSSNIYIAKLVVSGSNLFATSTNGGVFLSTNRGLSWAPTGLNNIKINCFAVIGSYVFAGCDNGVYSSSNNGINWMLTSLDSISISAFAVSDSNLFAATTGGGIFLSTNNGASWTAVNSGLTNKDILSVAVNDTILLAGTSGNGVFRSTNCGISWTQTNITTENIVFLGVIRSNFIAISDGYWNSTNNIFWVSTNSGESWATVEFTDELPRQNLDNFINGYAITDSALFILYEDDMPGPSPPWGELYRSIDYGAHWRQVNVGMTEKYIGKLTFIGQNLIAAAYGGIFLSTDNGIKWNHIGLLNHDISDFAISKSNIYAGSFYSQGLFRSTDNGIHWTKSDSGITSKYIASLAVCPDGVNGTKLFAEAYGVGIFLSTNEGASWNEINLPFSEFINMVYIDTILFAGSIDNGVFRSTDWGTSWVTVNNGLTNTRVPRLAISGSNLFVGTDSGGVFLSTNYGLTWNPVNSGITNMNIRCLAVKDSFIIAITYQNEIFISQNNGTSWNAFIFKLPSIYNDIYSASFTDSSVILGTDIGVWSRPLSDIVTSYNRDEDNTPETFSLSQNYPNPFNPSTVIRYQLPVSSHVSIKIYDLLGREVATLVSKEQSAGWKEVQWNASGFASGVYLVRMQAGNYVNVKKILLMK